jgi:hypothetical protein
MLVAPCAFCAGSYGASPPAVPVEFPTSRRLQSGCANEHVTITHGTCSSRGYQNPSSTYACALAIIDNTCQAGGCNTASSFCPMPTYEVQSRSYSTLPHGCLTRCAYSSYAGFYCAYLNSNTAGGSASSTNRIHCKVPSTPPPPPSPSPPPPKPSPPPPSPPLPRSPPPSPVYPSYCSSTPDLWSPSWASSRNDADEAASTGGCAWWIQDASSGALRDNRSAAVACATSWARSQCVCAN